jgi:hypothetical protein
VAATRFSKGNRSFGTPTVNAEYGVPFGLGLDASSEKTRNDDDAAEEHRRLLTIRPEFLAVDTTPLR